MQHAATPDGEQHLYASNYGWYLFGAVPIFCGNAAADGVMPFVMFRDEVTMDKIKSRLTGMTNELGVEIEDLVCIKQDQALINLPFTHVSIPIPYLLCYREVQLSGVAK